MTATKKVRFKQDWTKTEFGLMQQAIVKYYKWKQRVWNGVTQQMPTSWAGISNLLGLSYTSSSSYAGYWVCNGDLEFQPTATTKYNVIGFAIGDDGLFYGVAWDDKEKEIIFKLD